MITDAFDKSEVLFGPKDFYGEQKNLCDKCIIVFSEVIFEYMLETYEHEQAGVIQCCNGVTAVYVFEIDGNKLIRMLGNNIEYNQRLDDFIDQRLDFRATDADIQPFVSIGLNEIGDKVIRKLILGSNTVIRMTDIKLFLKKVGLSDCVIEKSALSYRN